MRDNAKTGLANWAKTVIDYGLLNQLAGNTHQTNLAYTGNNAPVAPDTAHWIYSNGKLSENGGTPLTSSDTLNVKLINQFVALAQGTLDIPIKPVVIGGIEVAGILFIHPLQARDLRNNYTDGEWGSIFRSSLQGGQVQGNPIFTGAWGMIGNVVIHVDARIPWGDDTQLPVFDSNSGQFVTRPNSLGVTNVARSVFVGAQACAFACGAEEGPLNQPLRVQWYEEILDAGNQLRVTAGLIWGVKKTIFNSRDYGVIVGSTWAQV